MSVARCDRPCGGGGTHALIVSNPRMRQLDLAVDAFETYTATPETTLDLIARPTDYLPTLARRLAEVEPAALSIDLCLYNAGMDPFEGCIIGGLQGMTAEILVSRDRLVFDWCRANATPVAFVLAGGYADNAGRAQLVDLHRGTIEAAGGAIEASGTKLTGSCLIGLPSRIRLLDRHRSDLVLPEPDGQDQPLDEPRGHVGCSSRWCLHRSGRVPPHDVPEPLLGDPQLIAQDVLEEISSELVAQAV